MHDFLTEVCRLCELSPGRSESFQTAFSPGKDKGPVTEEQKGGILRGNVSFLDEQCMYLDEDRCMLPSRRVFWWWGCGWWPCGAPAGVNTVSPDWCSPGAALRSTDWTSDTSVPSWKHTSRRFYTATHEHITAAQSDRHSTWSSDISVSEEKRRICHISSCTLGPASTLIATKKGFKVEMYSLYVYSSIQKCAIWSIKHSKSYF